MVNLSLNLFARCLTRTNISMITNHVFYQLNQSDIIINILNIFYLILNINYLGIRDKSR